MKRTLRPLVAFALVALISVISAGCGSDASSETGTANSSGTARRSDTADHSGTTSHSGSATDSHGLAGSSLGAPPSPPSPTQDPRMQA